MDNIVVILDHVKEIVFMEEPDTAVYVVQLFLVEQIKAYAKSPYTPIDDETWKICKVESISKNFPGLAILFGKTLFT